MKQDTKHKILEAGARIIHHKGFHHTGIQEVLNAAGVPKGSFYFYFKSKDDFGLHIIDFFNAMYIGMLEPILTDKDLSPLKRIEKIFDYYTDVFEKRDYQCGCPIGNLSQEMGDLNPAFSDKLTASVEMMANIYQNILDEAKDSDDIAKDLDTSQMAEFIVSSWHGALIKMKINRSVEPLRLHKKFILEFITK
ncbi:MAG: TetR/AcrR family transcriptional regulator [Desulfobacula sp.]|nr:TetR/AcrR family transcriptional regulator [Desulfobacula sp.]